MLAGFSGHLISEQFLEQRLNAQARDKPSLRIRLELRRWRQSQQLLGPASSVRTMLEAGAVPLARVLGFNVVANIGLDETLASATLHVDGSTIVLVVARWGERLDPLWRHA